MNYKDLRKSHLEALYHLGETASAQKVAKAFVDYIQSAIPGVTIRERSSFSHDPCTPRVLSIDMPFYHSNWVIIIEQENIKKNNGHNCLKVYHLKKAIPFNEYSRSPFTNFPFSVGYALICAKSSELLNSFDFLLSPEAVAVEMILSFLGS